MITKSDFADFLKFSNSQKEVSLAIARDEEELKEIQELLETNHYRRANHASQLLLHIDAPAKIYYLISEKLPKEIYDFIIQYPTGQVEIFDSEKMKSSVVQPSYSDVSVIFLITKDNLANIRKDNFEMLNNTGITYQS